MLLLLSACASAKTWTGPPGHVATADIPRLWNWAGTPVTVADARRKPANMPVRWEDSGLTWETLSEQVVQETRRVLLEAIGPASPGARYDLAVTIEEHGVIFTGPNWVGRTKLKASLGRFRDGPESEWTATGEASKWNWLGIDTARSALASAYESAMVDLMRQLAAASAPAR
jgi:hypothetical protein